MIFWLRADDGGSSVLSCCLITIVILVIKNNLDRFQSSSLTSVEAASILPSSTTQQKLVVFSFDGFRWDYIDQKRTPNLYLQAKTGVVGHMKSTFVTKTYPNHQSIVTGLYQPYHGIINNAFFDPFLNETFKIDNFSSSWWDQNNISLPIFIANQLFQSKRYSAVIQWPGGGAKYTDGSGRNNTRQRAHYFQDFSFKADFVQLIDQLITWMTDPVESANLGLVYIPEPDKTAHSYGPFSRQVFEQIEKIDKLVGYFQRRLITSGLLRRTNVLYLSDHGMAEINADRILYLNKCETEFPGLRYRMYGSSPVFSLIPLSGPFNFTHSSNQNLAEQVRQTLNLCSTRLFQNHFRAYLQNEIPKDYHYNSNKRILPIFIVADEGYELAYDDYGWRPEGWPIWGNHGYNASLPSMRPLFIARGPRFKKFCQFDQVFENIDLYPLMLNLLEIPVDAYKSNGTFKNVRGMLSNKLYMNDEDAVFDDAHSKINLASNFEWIRLIIYLLMGFAFLISAGICFVLSAGLNKRTVTRTTWQKRATRFSNDGSKFFFYLRQMITSRHHEQSDSYQMFPYSRPSSHLDSSSSSYEDGFKNDNRMKNVRSSSIDKKSNSNKNQLMEIDWDIIGTGLDIDLASQIRESSINKRTDREEYLVQQSDGDADPYSSNSKEFFKSTKKIDEYASLFSNAALEDNEDDCQLDDEEIKSRINIEEFEKILFSDSSPPTTTLYDDNENRHKNSDKTKLIDF